MSSFDNIQPPKLQNEIGNLHPINQINTYLINLLKSFGFKEIHGPEIESEELKFLILNIKNSHTTRKMN